MLSLAMSDPFLRIEGALASLPRGAILSGRTSAWLDGLDFEPFPVQATLPPGATLTSRKDLVIRRAVVPTGDIVWCRGFPKTSTRRTLLDLSNQLPLVSAVAAADQALHMDLVSVDELAAYVRARVGTWGVSRFRRVLGFAEPATESPMETELRMLIILNGLPRPEAQVTLYDPRDLAVGRVDFFYRKERVGLEFDGGGHRDQLVADNRRQNLILALDINLLRFTSPDLHSTPDLTALQTGAAVGVLCKKPLTRAEWARFFAQKPPRVVGVRLPTAV